MFGECPKLKTKILLTATLMCMTEKQLHIWKLSEMYIKLLSEISLRHKTIIVERDFNNFLHTMFDFFMTRTYYSYSYNTESKRKLLGGYILQNSQFVLSHVTFTYLPPYLMVTCCQISFKGQSQLLPFT